MGLVAFGGPPKTCLTYAVSNGDDNLLERQLYWHPVEYAQCANGRLTGISWQLRIAPVRVCRHDCLSENRQMSGCGGNCGRPVTIRLQARLITEG